MRREIEALPGLCKALVLAVENGDDVALSTGYIGPATAH